ncbi:protein NDR1-like [Bidens hawaiensis]|uniref:protein NDR1-like n=1 Tax=Bidens hawaiensis TaxID=980011 RepID=UPI00404B857A
MSDYNNSSGTGCFRCCFSFTLTLGLTSLFMWLSLRTSNPILSIQDVYIPALNKTLNSTSYQQIYLDLKLDNTNKDKGVHYDPLNITLQYYLNNNGTRITVSNYTLGGFYQGHNKKARRKNWTEMYGVPWEDAANGGVFRVDLTTAIRFKIVFWKTKRKRLVVGADFEVNDVGKKKQYKGTRLKSGATEVVSGRVVIGWF